MERVLSGSNNFVQSSRSQGRLDILSIERIIYSYIGHSMTYFYFQAWKFQTNENLRQMSGFEKFALFIFCQKNNEFKLKATCIDFFVEIFITSLGTGKSQYLDTLLQFSILHQNYTEN